MAPSQIPGTKQREANFEQTACWWRTDKDL